jgi:hypothetical protein
LVVLSMSMAKNHPPLLGKEVARARTMVALSNGSGDGRMMIG